VDSTWASFAARFRIPLIAAPMTAVSGFDIVAAATAAGIGGSFPVHNAASPAEVDQWLGRLADGPGPVIPNVVVHKTNARLADDVDVLAARRVPAVITSVGSPEPVVERLHDAGVLVLSDVASMRHAERAIAAGADGLVLLTAGAGGQTGWANPLAFARAIRHVWSGPMILAGGVSDGASLLAALVAGFDLVYMGTPFIATTESAVPHGWKDAVVTAGIDDIELTSEFTGLPTSMIRAADPVAPRNTGGDFHVSRLGSAELDGQPANMRYSAGHSAAGVHQVLSVAELVEGVERQMRDTQAAFVDRWLPPATG
jgi:nitronate monooxygenase